VWVSIYGRGKASGGGAYIVPLGRHGLLVLRRWHGGRGRVRMWAKARAGEAGGHLSGLWAGPGLSARGTGASSVGHEPGIDR
jgi:hypothetical protein